MREKGKGRQREGKWSVKERGMQWVGKECERERHAVGRKGGGKRKETVKDE